MQKLLLAILIASRKLRHYFEAHPITVVSKYNLKGPLQNRNATGRIAEWALELSGFGLNFEHSDAIKSQVLADFTAEWTETAFDWGQAPSSLPGKEDPSS